MVRSDISIRGNLVVCVWVGSAVGGMTDQWPSLPLIVGLLSTDCRTHSAG